MKSARTEAKARHSDDDFRFKLRKLVEITVQDQRCYAAGRGSVEARVLMLSMPPKVDGRNFGEDVGNIADVGSCDLSNAVLISLKP